MVCFSSALISCPHSLCFWDFWVPVAPEPMQGLMVWTAKGGDGWPDVPLESAETLRCPAPCLRVLSLCDKTQGLHVLTDHENTRGKSVLGTGVSLFLVRHFHSCHGGKTSILGDATSAFFFRLQNNLISNFWLKGLSPWVKGSARTLAMLASPGQKKLLPHGLCGQWSQPCLDNMIPCGIKAKQIPGAACTRILDQTGLHTVWQQEFPSSQGLCSEVMFPNHHQAHHFFSGTYDDQGFYFHSVLLIS